MKKQIDIKTARNRAIGSHQSARMITDIWLTPPEIINALGSFDLDPCTPEEMPWQTALNRYTEKDDGLLQPWSGRVWLNPPYGNQTGLWLNKLASHGDGVALTFARTETEMFFREIWEKGDGILFLRGRLHFHHPDGTRAKANAGAPSCLIGYGMQNAECLEGSGIPGQYVPLSYTHFIVIGNSPSWFNVVGIALKNYDDRELKAIYEIVERIAPDKVSGNEHWREKVRQQIQRHRKKRTFKNIQ